MGDCGKNKCLQEKRAFKRELLSWFKKVPYVAGLELVAENLAGGCIKTLLFPFNEMEPTEPRDFGEDTDTPCVFCEGQDTPPDPEPAEPLLELPQPSAAASTSTINDSMSEPSPLKSKKKGSEMFHPLKQLSSVPTADVDVEGLNSFYNQLAMTSLLYQQHQQLQTAAMAAAVQEATATIQGCHDGKQTRPGPKEERPLDLTSTPLLEGFGAEASSSSMEFGELRIPEIKSKKKDRAMKKNYSDRELNAAVEAIKSGAIGTRRAAQLYGIPRSTLRNKVFKSAEMNKSHLDELGLCNASALTGDPDKNGTELVKSERISPNSEPEASTITSSPNTGKTKASAADMAQYNNTFLRQLEEMRVKQNLNEQLTAAANNRLFSDMFNPLQLPSGYNPFLMPQYAGLAATIPGYEYLNPYASSLMMPYLPELVKNLTQKRLELEQSQPLPTRTRPEVSPSLSAVKREAVSRSPADADDIKVPEYKPAIGLPLEISANLSSAESLKNSVSSRTTPPNFSASSYLQNLLPFQESPVTKKQTNMDSHLPHKRSRGECSNTNNDTSNSSFSNGSTPMGKKRPKRGQYRKYDSELLAQAVRAVQRGEMSVHRAGTFFGVPHSTLEYKVKERHLLRKKKMAENSENKVSASPNTHKPSTTAANLICPYSSDSSQSAKCLDNSNNSLNNEANEADHISDDGNSTTVAQSTPENKFLDFPTPYEKFPEMSTPASELLKRLHERAQKRAAEIFNAQNSSKEATDSTKLVESLTN